MSVPEEIALGEEPRGVQPGDVAQLLELLIVAGHVGVSIVSDRPVSSFLSMPAAVLFFGLHKGDARQGPVVLHLVLELGDLGHDLLALLALVGVVARTHSAVSIIDSLCLEKKASAEVKTGQAYGWRKRAHDDDGPSFARSLVRKRRGVARQVARCGGKLSIRE